MAAEVDRGDGVSLGDQVFSDAVPHAGVRGEPVDQEEGRTLGGDGLPSQPPSVRPSSWSTASPRTRACGTASPQTWSPTDTASPPSTCAATAVPRSRTGPTTSRPSRTTSRPSSTASGSTGRSSPASPGAATSPSSSRPSHPSSIRGIVCVDGGWLEPSRVFPDWESCREVLAPPRLAGRPLTEVEAYVRSAHQDWPETGIRGALANFEVRPDGTIAPWLTFDRHIAVLRGLWDHHPSQLYAGLAVAGPSRAGPRRATDTTPTESAPQIDEALAAIPTARACWFTGHHDIHAQRPDEVADLMHRATLDGFFA